MSHDIDNLILTFHALELNNIKTLLLFYQKEFVFNNYYYPTTLITKCNKLDMKVVTLLLLSLAVVGTFARVKFQMGFHF